MDKELKTKWVAALRSGKYKQGRGEYRSDDGCYCALGVLLNVMAHYGWAYSNTRRLVAAGLRPDRVIKDNDNGLSFNEIADKVEAGAYDR